MRFTFKTNYNQDIQLLKHSGYIFWYSLLLVALVVIPFTLSDYYTGQLVQVAIYATAGLGLMVLAGFTGQVSLGHAAFFGIGAYTEAALLTFGIPFPLSFFLAGLLAAAVGLIVGPPALRLSGIYLAIATLAFAIIIEEILSRWVSVTKGYTGLHVPSAELFGIEFSEGIPFYFLAMTVLIGSILFVLNLLRSPLGRAMIAIRDSEIAAQSMGVHLAGVKTTAFGISAFITGLAGGLWAHKLGFLSPESFTIFQSIEFLVLVVVGGLGSIHGAVFGAIFMVALPQIISMFKGFLPDKIADQPGLEAGFFGVILVLFILFEPLGIYGRWMKIKLYFQMFPMYKKSTFKRQKSYIKSERLR